MADTATRADTRLLRSSTNRIARQHHRRGERPGGPDYRRDYPTNDTDSLFDDSQNRTDSGGDQGVCQDGRQIG
jgi:hypothetical protein